MPLKEKGIRRVRWSVACNPVQRIVDIRSDNGLLSLDFGDDQDDIGFLPIW